MQCPLTGTEGSSKSSLSEGSHEDVARSLHRVCHRCSSGGSNRPNPMPASGLAHAARFEERQNGIRTCVVCPGLVDTELVQRRPVKPTTEMLQAALQPEDVAEMILAVASLPARAVVPEIQILPTTL